MSIQSHQWILILDYGSQYTQLIARRIRELNVYCEIHPFNVDNSQFEDNPPSGVILSGGPKSVRESDAPFLPEWVLAQSNPVLGVCYGLQVIANTLKPKSVDAAVKREFGRAQIVIERDSILFNQIPSPSTVWMSHGDHLNSLPEHFHLVAKSENAIAGIEHDSKPIYGVQFHPEVVHTDYGKQFIHNFVRDICKCSGDWTTTSFIDETIQQIKDRVGSKKVICGLSGGVDSTVTAVLLHKALGAQLQCVFVDNGLLRKNEFANVLDMYTKDLSLPVKGVDASEKFLSELAGVVDPETKRKIIGRVFIEVFDDSISHDSEFAFLAQGTLYPDVIESVSFKGPSATIKSHHNVGGLPEKMNLSLIEPLRELFKDEVRRVGKDLGIPDHFLERHPFPGPGLAIRVISDITKSKLDLLREADDIFISELRSNGLYNTTWQAFAVLLPVQSVGVMGDERTYENVVALRSVTSVDGMTADWAHLPYSFIAHVSNRIINEVKGINRVVYDVSSKPPATIEWE